MFLEHRSHSTEVSKVASVLVMGCPSESMDGNRMHYKNMALGHENDLFYVCTYVLLISHIFHISFEIEEIISILNILLGGEALHDETA